MMSRRAVLWAGLATGAAWLVSSSAARAEDAGSDPMLQPWPQPMYAAHVTGRGDYYVGHVDMQGWVVTPNRPEAGTDGQVRVAAPATDGHGDQYIYDVDQFQGPFATPAEACAAVSDPAFRAQIGCRDDGAASGGASESRPVGEPGYGLVNYVLPTPTRMRDGWEVATGPGYPWYERVAGAASVAGGVATIFIVGWLARLAARAAGLLGAGEGAATTATAEANAVAIMAEQALPGAVSSAGSLVEVAAAQAELSGVGWSGAAGWSQAGQAIRTAVETWTRAGRAKDAQAIYDAIMAGRNVSPDTAARILSYIQYCL